MCHFRRKEKHLEGKFTRVNPYADRESPKYERAALRWLGRYLAEDAPTLRQFVEVTATLAGFDPTAP